MTKREVKESLDRELEPVRLSEERKAAILAAMEEEKGAVPVKEKKQMFRMVILAAAMCVLLSAAALAASPSLRAALSAALAGFGTYQQSYEGIVAEESGIRIEVLSAIADEEAGVVYLEVEDTAGENLTEYSVLLNGINQIGCQEYDSETNSAVFVYRLQDFNLTYDPENALAIMDEEGNAHLSIRGLIPESKILELELPWEKLTPEELVTRTIEEEDLVKEYQIQKSEEKDTIRVLEPEQTPMELGNEWFYLSSMGYDDQGMLHVQFRLADGVDCTESGGPHPELPIVLKDTGEEITSSSTRTYPDGSITAWEWYRKTYFKMGDTVYCDVIFPHFMADDFENVDLKNWIISFSPRPVIRGTWELTFPLETDLPTRVITCDETIGKSNMDTLKITPLGMQAEGTWWENGSGVSYEAILYLKDGSTIRVGKGRGSFLYDRFTSSWRFPQAVESEEIIGISLGAWYIPIHEDNTAGPGYWLETTP